MKKLILFTFAGSLVGGFYYYFIGCNNSCAITRSPINSTTYGAALGFILGFPTEK